MEKIFNIAIAGLGTIGGGTLKLLQSNASLLKERCGVTLKVVAVLERDKGKQKILNLEGIHWASSVEELVGMKGLDLIVELIGGSEGIAKTLVESALKAGKHVVTANKALIAHHGTELARIAEASGAMLAYEAAVAGGIPIIKSLREGLVANDFKSIAGIMNGTCNFILTSMRDEHKEFDVALAEAQRVGYAEADPSFDIDGVDTAHKLAIMTSLAYGCPVNIGAVYVEGIRGISVLDMDFADKLGYTIKLLGIAQRTEKGILQRVHPCLVGKASALGRVSGVFNGVVVDGDPIGRITMEGRGAGEGPTASSVVGDIADIARGGIYKPFTVAADHLKPLPLADIETLVSPYYVRLVVTDKPGVLAAITGIFRDQGISMRSFLQHSHAPGESVQVVMTTHETLEKGMRAALNAIGALDSVIEPPHMIRIENL
ncbi:MAG TPA: homoserine dehydrogenase [Rickettsiales bacterium]|nr:homoserine dehydrogenase [Rickettsiales bacterium]